MIKEEETYKHSFTLGGESAGMCSEMATERTCEERPETHLWKPGASRFFGTMIGPHMEGGPLVLHPDCFYIS